MKRGEICGGYGNWLSVINFHLLIVEYGAGLSQAAAPFEKNHRSASPVYG